MLFSRILQALDAATETFFEPDQQAQLRDILCRGGSGDTLTKVLIGRVLPKDSVLTDFDKHIVIYRDPRDQFISMLLYLFYDFQLSGDQAGYDECFAALQRKQQNPSDFSAIELYNQVASCVGRAPVAVFNKLHRVQKDYIAAFAPFEVRYEELLDGQWGELEAHLQLTLKQDAPVPVEYSRVVRSKGYGDWRNWLNADDTSYIDKHWGESIRALGYAEGEAEQNQRIARETTLDYVSQFDPRRHPAAQ